MNCCTVRIRLGHDRRFRSRFLKWFFPGQTLRFDRSALVDSDELKRRLREVDAGKVRERGRRIDRLVEEAASRGEDADRLFWTIVHDLEHAPRTTNRRQLEELGFRIPSRCEVPRLSPAALEALLQAILESLALIHVFVRGGKHLSKRCLLEHLIEVVLEEPVPDLPHALASRQWVDLPDS